MAVRIGIVGDFDAGNRNHAATEAALEHSAAVIGARIDAEWIATDSVLGGAGDERLAAADGVWCTTGSPYRSLEGALRAIRLARECRIPFLGTCGGFQHAVLEFARNVAGLEAAEHAEYEGSSADAVIAALECSLAGKWFEVDMRPDTRAARCYGALRPNEQYYCSYGIHPRWLPVLVDRGLPVVAWAEDGTPRIIEDPEHPFFIATLFVPQARSTASAPHPLVTGFVRAAASGRG